MSTGKNYTASSTASDLADQVQKWYDGGKEKRDQIVRKLRVAGLNEIADDIIRWFDKGDERFHPLIERLRDFAVTQVKAEIDPNWNHYCNECSSQMEKIVAVFFGCPLCGEIRSTIDIDPVPEKYMKVLRQWKEKYTK